nr:putative ribonuclease H-like domain-containing protein [Tanacetum cinerariifolium]
MIRVAIGGKSKSLLSHLTADPPDQTSEDYEQWEQEDLIVFSWLIQNIEPALAGNLTEYPTAKMLWDALMVTYSSGRDKLQTFNLHDIRTGAIIGRGTEIKGLYYMDEVTQNGAVMLSHRMAEREAWLWDNIKPPVLTLLNKMVSQNEKSSQGESECLDTLNWLRYVACGDGRSHSSANESHLSTQPEDHVNVTQTAPSLIPEVSNPSPISNPIETNASWQGECTGTRYERYVLPPRANRGVPPKRYSPEKVSRGSRYPMANIAKGNLSKEAKAFVASVYSDEIPANTEQALMFSLPMKNHGFKQSNSDHTLFLKQRGNLITYLIIYVDDMIVTGDDKEEITKLKKYLFTEFEMKDLGRLKYFLRNEVLRSKQVYTPMIVNQKLYMEEKAVLAEKGRYQRMKNHMKAVMRILRYLKGTTRHGVLFKQNGHLVTQLYTDADWAGDKGNRRSTSSYFTVVGRNLVTWRSKKQKVVSLSSAEAEFRGIARGLTEMLWIRRLLTEIGYPPQEASKIMSDNKTAIQISEIQCNMIEPNM